MTLCTNVKISVTNVLSANTHVFVVRIVISIDQPSWLCIRNLADFSNHAAMNHTLLSFNDTDLKAGELGFHYHVVHVKAVECLSGILAGCTQIFQC